MGEINLFLSKNYKSSVHWMKVEVQSAVYFLGEIITRRKTVDG